jgi:cytosine/adenosine deaminase-related metal-dependent hydrolase
LFTNLGDPIPNGLLWVNDEGTIERVLSSEDADYHSEDAAWLEGWLGPGFINTHCHLELSHLKGKIQEHTGLNGFVSELMKIRGAEDSFRIQAQQAADAEMYKSGIVAVADICNGNSTFEVKKNSPIYYHSLIERFGFKAEAAELIFQEGLTLLEALNPQPGNICLHAPYSASIALQELVKQHLNESSSGFYSIHHAESEAEIALFREGSGEMANRMRGWGLFENEFPYTAMRPVDYLLEHFPDNKNILLIHNTFSNSEDLEKLQHLNNRLFFGLCPRANLYIENYLPNIELLRKSNHHITIGTDSLASNYSLGMLEEIFTIQQHFPEIPITELFKWSSLNGAKLMGLDKSMGHFSPGSQPGIVQIHHVDNTHKKITSKSFSRLI